FLRVARHKPLDGFPARRGGAATTCRTVPICRPAVTEPRSSVLEVTTGTIGPSAIFQPHLRTFCGYPSNKLPPPTTNSKSPLIDEQSVKYDSTMLYMSSP